MNNNIRIGVITMHRVQNYGSILQAYALQHTLEKLGYYNELIDYIFPNSVPQKRRTLLQKTRHTLRNILLGNPSKTKHKKFEQFKNTFLNCTATQFNSPKELTQAKFNYDVFITGSDQVWNPKHIKNDYSFFLDFVPDKIPKLSYAASFSCAEINPEIAPIYTTFLNRYNYLSVREESGIKIIRHLTNKNSELVCDPTLLLEKKDWINLINNKKNAIKGKYILVYILSYSYNPYPEINNIISKIQQQLNMHIVILDGSLQYFKKTNTSVIKKAGPIDFINLMANASFIITTSFHGTAFALNLEIPFLSVVKSNDNQSDTRILSLLKRVGAENRSIVYNSTDFTITPTMDFDSIRKNITTFRTKSISYLTNAINSSLQ